MSQKLSLVLVKWYDTFSKGGWFSPDEVSKIIEEDKHLIETVGFKVCQNNKYLVLCQSYDGDDSDFMYGFLKVIPLMSIKEIKVIVQAKEN